MTEPSLLIDISFGRPNEFSIGLKLRQNTAGPGAVIKKTGLPKRKVNDCRVLLNLFSTNNLSTENTVIPGGERDSAHLDKSLSQNLLPKRVVELKTSQRGGWEEEK